MLISKQRLYHWYFDTQQRYIYPNISDGDKQIIRECVISAVTHSQALNKEL